MTSVGTTGPRGLTVVQNAFVEQRFVALLAELSPSEVVSGCAEGVDSVCAYAAEEAGAHRVPFVRLTIATVASQGQRRVLPCNKALLDHALRERAKPEEERRWFVEYGEPGQVAGEGYLKRDDLTVARSTVLAAFPKTPQEEQRSGTWATIRRARKAGIEIRLFPLDRSKPWVEAAAERLFS